MKGPFIKYLSVFVILCLVLCAACGCFQPQEEPTTFATDPTEELPIMQGTVAAETLNIYSGPDASCMVVGTLYQGDQVLIYEALGQWVRIADGWIDSSLLEGYNSGEGALTPGTIAPTQPNNTPSATDPTQSSTTTEATQSSSAPNNTETPTPPSGTIDPSILGSWYYFRPATEPDTYYIYMENFYENGSCGDAQEEYVVGSGKTTTLGGVSDLFSFDGSTVTYANYYPGLPASQPSYVSASVSGDTLILGGETYTRGTLRDAMAAIDRQHASSADPS